MSRCVMSASNNPVLREEKFVPGPFHFQTIAVMFRSRFLRDESTNIGLLWGLRSTKNDHMRLGLMESLAL